jgi:hypothetical protein
MLFVYVVIHHFKAIYQFLKHIIFLVKIVANASFSEPIKQNDEIKGIQIPNTDREAKMFSHADKPNKSHT